MLLWNLTERRHFHTVILSVPSSILENPWDRDCSSINVFPRFTRAVLQLRLRGFYYRCTVEATRKTNTLQLFHFKESMSVHKKFERNVYEQVKNIFSLVTWIPQKNIEEISCRLHTVTKKITGSWESLTIGQIPEGDFAPGPPSFSDFQWRGHSSLYY